MRDAAHANIVARGKARFWVAALTAEPKIEVQKSRRLRWLNKARSLLAWLVAHAPELALVGFGIALRLLATRSYRPDFGYDFWEHEQTINWWKTRFTMPPFGLSRGAYHPQPYYALCGLILRLGGTPFTLQSFSVLLGCVRLLLLWWAAERYLKQRGARLIALGLAAVLPMSVQLDVNVTQEPLNNLVSTLFVIAVMRLSSAPASAVRWRRGVILGVVAGLGLLTKVSGLILIGVMGIGALLELWQSREASARQLFARTTPWLLAVAVASIVSAPQYVYNRVTYDNTFPDGWYRRPTPETKATGAQRKDVLDRRSLGFVFDFTPDVVRFAFYPSGITPTPRFWSVLIASSFSDYYGYRFGPESDAWGTVPVNQSRVGLRAATWAGASVASGIGIVLFSAVAGIVALLRSLTRREVARPTVLALPLLGLIGALYFAIQHPYDFEGVIKGHYLLFAMVPVFALFGGAVDWCLRRRWLVPVGGLGLLLLACPAVYTCICVFR